jgi:hypothetical protein
MEGRAKGGLCDGLLNLRGFSILIYPIFELPTVQTSRIHVG